MDGAEMLESLTQTRNETEQKMTIFDRDERTDRHGIAGTLSRIGRAAAVTLVLTLGVGVTGLAVAHGPGKHRGQKLEAFQKMSEEERLEKMQERVDRRVAHMTERLDLSDAQQTEIRKIVTAGHKRALEVLERADEAENRGQIRRQLHQIRKQTREDVRALLTDEQKSAAKEARAQRRAKRPERMMERLDERLDLNPEQEAQVEAILSEAQNDIQTLRADASARSDSKAKGRRGQRGKRHEVGKIMRGAADDIASVLDDEQAAEFAEMREEFRERRGNRHGKRGDGPRGNRGPATK
jgi:Spy/CpxP family protein refolding chaperone